MLEQASSAIEFYLLSKEHIHKIKLKESMKLIAANDYLVKLPEPIELVARVRAHSRHYLSTKLRNEATRIIQEKLTEASSYQALKIAQ